MPEITTETPRTEITVAGKNFSVPQPYTAGVVLNANEASALNQTYAENLRNNFASKVKEAVEAGSFDEAVFQGRMDDYASEYEFGVRTGGGRTGDPVRNEAMSIARDLVRKALAKKPDIKLSDVPASKITELAKAALDRGDDKSAAIMAAAQARVDAAKEITDISIDDATSAEVAASETAPKSRKQPAEAAA